MTTVKGTPPPTANQSSTTLNRKLVTFSVLVALFLAAMDSTVMGTLLPVLKVEFGHPDLYPWLMSGFIFSTILATPLIGLMADRIGEKLMMIISVVLFMLGSFSVSEANSMQQLIATRVFQGIGAGGITVLAYIVIGKIFSAQERGKMQGLLSAVWGLAAICGPLAGSLLHQYVSWHWAFLLNIPLGFAVLLMFSLLYKNNPPKNKISRFDTVGFIFFAVSVASLLYLILSPTFNGQFNIGAIPLAISIASSAILIFSIRRKKQNSFLAHEFFEDFAFIASAAAIVIASMIMYASVTMLPLYIVELQQQSVVLAGMMVLMASFGWVAGATLCGIQTSNIGFRNCTIIGYVSLICGTVLLWTITLHYLQIVAFMAQLCIGLGIGYVASATLVFAQNHSKPERVGAVTSAVQLFRNLGAAIGINSLAAIHLYFSQQLGIDQVIAFKFSFLVLTVLAIIGLMISFKLPHRTMLN